MKVYFSLGSNMGMKASNLANAKSLLSKYIGPVISESKLYESEPWGNEDQASFINQCIICETSLSCVDILELTQRIENQLGKNKKGHWGPRFIDIDILFYDDHIIDSNDLVVPHPLLHERNFVLEPLNEIAPDLIHPILKKGIKELYRFSRDHKKTSIIC